MQADLKTFAALGVYGVCSITALTVQNSRGVSLVSAVEPALVAAQIDAVVSDFGADATKIGMLVNAALVEVVAEAILRHRLPHVVLDPVLHATSGTSLLDKAALPALMDKLLPLAEVVTPNASEAAELTGQPVTTLAEQRRAAELLISRGARAVVVKGGHLDGPFAIDVFYDGRIFKELRAERVQGRHTHGTGCTFSSAIAARLAQGADLVTAVHNAKEYVSDAIAQAPGIGHGSGPLQHFPHGKARLY
jgi:hydroxymethylpyrimidine/phosphomethylpyrimidine kinase